LSCFQAEIEVAVALQGDDGILWFTLGQEPRTRSIHPARVSNWHGRILRTL